MGCQCRAGQVGFRTSIQFPAAHELPMCVNVQLEGWRNSGEGGTPVKLCESEVEMGWILLLLMTLFLVGGLPAWPYSRSWGYGPSGILGAMLVILVLLMLFNLVPFGGSPFVVSR